MGYRKVGDGLAPCPTSLFLHSLYDSNRATLPLEGCHLSLLVRRRELSAAVIYPRKRGRCLCHFRITGGVLRFWPKLFSKCVC